MAPLPSPARKEGGSSYGIDHRVYNDPSPWRAMTRLHLVLQDPSKIQQKAMQSMFDCFEGLCEGTVIVDRDARVVWINDRYAARLGNLPSDN